MVVDLDLRSLLRDAITEAAGIDRRTQGRGKYEPARASHTSVARLKRRFAAILREIPEHYTVLDMMEVLEPENDGEGRR